MAEHSNIDAANTSEAATQAEVTQAIEQLPDSQQAGLAGIEELLIQLQAAVTASDQLPQWKKPQHWSKLKF